MEKTIEKRFELLPEPIMSEALAARRKAEERGPHLYPKGETARSLHGAIRFGFLWEEDGGSYDKWGAICAMRERIAELERENKAMAEKINAMSKILNQ